MRMAMMAITTNSSIKVNPRLRQGTFWHIGLHSTRIHKAISIGPLPIENTCAERGWLPERVPGWLRPQQSYPESAPLRKLRE